MSIFSKEIEQSRIMGQVDHIWSEVERLDRKPNKTRHEQMQLADLTKLAIELQSGFHMECFNRREQSMYTDMFGML